MKIIMSVLVTVVMSLLLSVGWGVSKPGSGLHASPHQLAAHADTKGPVAGCSKSTKQVSGCVKFCDATIERHKTMYKNCFNKFYSEKKIKDMKKSNLLGLVPNRRGVPINKLESGLVCNIQLENSTGRQHGWKLTSEKGCPCEKTHKNKDTCK